MASSLTYGVDVTLRTLLYARFGSILGINQLGDTQAECINLGVEQYPRETALRKIAEKRGEDFLEFINYWRMATSPAWDRQRTVLARRGMWLSIVDGTNLRAINVKAQPVDLQYNAWFWSKNLDIIYQCIEKYILWQQNYPKIDLTYVFDDNNSFTYSPELHFGEIVDESTAPEEYTEGLIFCYKMPIKVDAWVLEGSGTGKTITKIIVTLYDKDSIVSYSSIITPTTEEETEKANALRLSRRYLYYIMAVDLTNNTITTPNDRSADFTVGDKIRIEGSASNNGLYTVVSTSVVGGSTVIKLSESLSSSTVDGNIYRVN